jgi:hypothetical protein
VSVKTVFLFPPYKSFFRSSRAASVAILPSALFGERYSLGARWVFSFSRCCYLIIALSSYLWVGVGPQDLVAVTWTRRSSSAVPDRNSLSHSAHRFLAIPQWFVHLSAYPQPMQQYRQLSGHGNHRSFLGIFPSSFRKL